jgi:hypothetical protein
VFSVFTGFDPLHFATAMSRIPRFLHDAFLYRRAAWGSEFPFRLSDLHPILTDSGEDAGTMRGHYFHQDLWAARKIFLARPQMHIDLGSRIDGFVAHLLTFMPVTVVDVRSLDDGIDGLRFIRDDGTTLSTLADDSVESLSSLHAVEHFGLGRYGDRIDPKGCFRAMGALTRVLRPGGTLYFSVPIGRERLEFNAHRVFSPVTVIDAFRGLTLKSFAAVDDEGLLDSRATPEAYASADYSCGLFEFSKPGLA